MSSTSYENSSAPDPVVEPVSLATTETPIKPRVTSYNLPLQPLITIGRSKPWSPLNLRKLLAYRELLYFLIWRDVKVRYKQTAIGAMWAIIQPLTMMIIFTIFFSKLIRIPTDGIPSGLFYYSGMSLWMFFSNAVIVGASSLLGNTALITKVYFPKLIIPTAAVLAGVIDFAIASILLIALLIYYGYGESWEVLLLLPVSLLVTILALGMAILFSALNAKYRDVRYVLPFLLQIWMFITPIIYPASVVPKQWRWLLALNPLTGIVEGYRASLFGQRIHWQSLCYSTLFTIMLLSVAAYIFRRMEKSFAEVI
jgi:homopolymeric O-antigen transport system permease protein